MVVFGGGSSKPLLEIKPDTTFAVLSGSPSEAQPTQLTGKLVLTNPESMAVKRLYIVLSGLRKVSWMTNTVTPQPIVNKKPTFREELNIFPTDGSKNKSHKINQGVHEWNFKFTIPGNVDESVEGLNQNYVIYQLDAYVDRGYITKQLHERKHIRIIRTLGQDIMESVPMEQINEDIWGSKLAYKITVPQKNYIVGTSVTAHFVLVPLRKGVEIGTIKMEVVEHMVLYSEYAGRSISHASDRVVAHIEQDLPQDSEHLVPDGEDEADHLFDESHRFSLTLDLPKTLKQCRQSVDTENMKIVHKLRLYVNLHNPEGHTSQLLVKNHLNLFISPNLPPGEDQTVVVDHNVLSSTALRDEAHQTAPPTYGLHQLDELYNDIDPSGFMTPGPRSSGGNTPFYNQSRSGSAEDLTSLNAIADQDEGGASASALHSRLHNLSLNESNRTSRLVPTRHHSSGGNSSNNVANGYFAGVENYDMEALVRTPSYNTAVRTPARTPISEDLPTYDVATSRPSSPTLSPQSRHSTPSPARSLDTLTEETHRNTQMNSRHPSPDRSSGSSSGRS